MTEKLQAIRGMNDILPQQMPYWYIVESELTATLAIYGYEEIRMPLVESTQLFKRSIGDVTDIVEKEMYSFTDLNGDSITLRPEGTAGCVRACIEHGLLHNQQQRLWYMGPMFRHERPQKGRYRQFMQFGVEAFGIPGFAIELELIAICQRIWENLGIDNAIHLQLNSIGTLEERNQYKTILVDYFKTHFDQLDEDSKKRLERNPLRILDSKNPELSELIANAPKLLDNIGDESKDLFDKLCQGISALGINYTINPVLVRGLDYYGGTVFEWVTDQLGSQATVCAGGRYDSLTQQLGSNPTPAVGFALGIERLILLMQTLKIEPVMENYPSLYMIADGDLALTHAMIIAEAIHDFNIDYKVLTNTGGGSFKSQFKKADKSGARLALILGEEEVKSETIGVKDLRDDAPQITIAQKDLISWLSEFFNE